MINTQGRLAWQTATGYGQRALVETTMGRYKSLIGPRLRVRSAPTPVHYIFVTLFTKRLLTNKVSKSSSTNAIIPVAVKRVAFDVDCG